MLLPLPQEEYPHRLRRLQDLPLNQKPLTIGLYLHRRTYYLFRTHYIFNTFRYRSPRPSPPRHLIHHYPRPTPKGSALPPNLRRDSRAHHKRRPYPRHQIHPQHDPDLAIHAFGCEEAP